MSAFLEWLENMNERDTRVRAVLRRSLSFAPGAYRESPRAMGDDVPAAQEGGL